MVAPGASMVCVVMVAVMIGSCGAGLAYVGRTASPRGTHRSWTCSVGLRTCLRCVSRSIGCAWSRCDKDGLLGCFNGRPPGVVPVAISIFRCVCEDLLPARLRKHSKSH